MNVAVRTAVKGAVRCVISVVATLGGVDTHAQVGFRVAAEPRDFPLMAQADTSSANPKEQPTNTFNPDPGASAEVEPTPIPGLFPVVPPRLPEFGEEPVPRSLRLPRKGVKETRPDRHKLQYERYRGTEVPVSEGAEPVPNRWFIGFGRWQRYADPSAETPYQSELKLWHPYLRSTLKGDAPVIGQDIFLNLIVSDFFQLEARKLPTPSGVSAAEPNSSEFFGRSEQLFLSNDFSIAAELFKGETAFTPIQWALRFLAVYNNNYTDVKETNVLDPDPRLRNTTRYKDWYSLQEAFAEIHIRDLSTTYDFTSARFGIQSFVSDFRGFIFNDANLGVRIFGNYDNNRWQYNLAFFDMREKDTYSGLNEFDSRDQQVLVLNLYRQDFFARGYTAQISFHANFDGASRHYDKNGFLVRPAPIGAVQDHSVQSYYFGWTGDGHIGRLNISHAFYEVLGEDSFNVNPGVVIVGYGMDADITPKLKGFLNVNYIWTATTDVTKQVLFTNHASNDIGLDCSLGLQWRPLLTDNIILSAGFGVLVPGEGYKDIFRTNTRPVFGYHNPPPGKVDDFLYSALFTMTFTY